MCYIQLFWITNSHLLLVMALCFLFVLIMKKFLRWTIICTINTRNMSDFSKFGWWCRSFVLVKLRWINWGQWVLNFFNLIILMWKSNYWHVIECCLNVDSMQSICKPMNMLQLASNRKKNYIAKNISIELNSSLIPIGWIVMNYMLYETVYKWIIFFFSFSSVSNLFICSRPRNNRFAQCSSYFFPQMMRKWQKCVLIMVQYYVMKIYKLKLKRTTMFDTKFPFQFKETEVSVEI